MSWNIDETLWPGPTFIDIKMIAPTVWTHSLIVDPGKPFTITGYVAEGTCPREQACFEMGEHIQVYAPLKIDKDRVFEVTQWSVAVYTDDPHADYILSLKEIL